MLVYYDPIFLEHDTGSHPENASRLTAVMNRLHRSGLLDECSRPEWPPAAESSVYRVHEPAYVDSLRRWCEQGGGRIEEDTVVSRRSLDAALKAAGAAEHAVAQILNGTAARALCLVRPPGHHALPAEAMGFCLLNAVALAARVALDDCQLDRILIVDWDVHHGNGTQDIFWEDPQVGFFSIHRWPFYPGTGAADETGAGAGRGMTWNVPVAFGSGRQKYLEQFERTLEKATAATRPDLVLISAGFDAHRADPIGSLELESEDFGHLTRLVRDITQPFAQGRIVSLLEGGYRPAALAESIAFHLEALLER